MGRGCCCQGSNKNQGVLKSESFIFLGKRDSLLGWLSQSMWSGTANGFVPLALPEGRWQKLKASETELEGSRDTEIVSTKDTDH